MKYSLQCCIRTDNDGIRNAVKQVIPDIDDSRLWNVEYIFEDIVDEDGKVFICNVNFNAESDRNDITASVKGLAGIVNACEVGSFIREYKCYHDETPRRNCEEQTILRKD